MNLKRVKDEHVVGFQVHGRKKTDAGIYVPDKVFAHGEYSSTENLWVFMVGEGVPEDIKYGDKAIVSDAFELEDLGIKLYDQVVDDPKFKDMFDEVLEREASVTTRICHYRSILAIDDPS